MTADVVAFKRPEAPLQFVEVKLNEEDCSLVMTVHDEAGNIFCLDYLLGWSPPDFDLDRLRRGWAKWRGGSAPAS